MGYDGRLEMKLRNTAQNSTETAQSCYFSQSLCGLMSVGRIFFREGAAVAKLDFTNSETKSKTFFY